MAEHGRAERSEDRKLDQLVGIAWRDATSAGTVLVVGTDPVVREALAAALRTNRFRTLQAATVQRALRLASGGAADLVLLDLESAPERGIAVGTALRSGDQTRSIPVLALTAAGGWRAAREAGAERVLASPVRAEEIAEAARELAESARSGQRAGGTTPSIPEIRHDALSLKTVIQASVRFQLTPDNQPFLASFWDELHKLQIPFGSRVEDEETVVTFYPTISEALALGYNRDSPDALFFTLTGAYPRLAENPRALRERIDQLQAEHLRTRRLAG